MKELSKYQQNTLSIYHREIFFPLNKVHVIMSSKAKCLTNHRFKESTNIMKLSQDLLSHKIIPEKSIVTLTNKLKMTKITFQILGSSNTLIQVPKDVFYTQKEERIIKETFYRKQRNKCCKIALNVKNLVLKQVKI
jgi:hypothetical protein